MERNDHRNREQDAFWGETAAVDPLWEEWVLGPEVLDWLDKPLPSGMKRELWVFVPRVADAPNLALLHKIAASIGFAVKDIRINVVDSSKRSSTDDSMAEQHLVNLQVLFLGVAMPEIPQGSNPQWASAPDLNALGGDENARKSLWAQIKSWRIEPMVPLP